MRTKRLVVLVLVDNTDLNTNGQTDNKTDEEDDEGAPPFQLAGAASVCNTLVELDISGLGVLLDVLGVLFGLLDHWFLNDNGLGQVFEQLVELDKSALDLLDVVVTSTHGAKHGAGSRRTVGLELQSKSVFRNLVRMSRGTYGSLEDTLIAPISVCGLLDFGIRRLGY